jgi:GTP cyclohydrolase FolE2
MHLLPKCFVRIRHFGFLSNRIKKNNIRKIRDSLGQSTVELEMHKKTIEEIMLKLTGVDITRCPCCKKGTMRAVCEISKKISTILNEVIRPPNLRKAA